MYIFLQNFAFIPFSGNIALHIFLNLSSYLSELSFNVCYKKEATKAIHTGIIFNIILLVTVQNY